MECNKWNEVYLKCSKVHVSKLLTLSQDDMVKFCLKEQRNIVLGFLNNIKKSNLKDREIALQKKEEGNEKYKKKQFEESLSLYTESIFHAPKDDECLPLAYSNRSVVLNYMGYPLESIADIDMALDCGYPKHKVVYLILRKARCLSQLGDVEKATEILKETLKNSEMTYNKIIKNELQKIKNGNTKKSSSLEYKLPKLLGGENKNFPFASKHLNVHYDKVRGRHVIADQDIKPGEVLFVEESFAFVTFEKYCINCFKKTMAPIPCWSCVSAYYCSPKCRDNSWKSFHSFECGFAELFQTVGIAHLGLRVILKASCSLDELKKILSNISEPVYENGNIVLINKGYEAVYNLVHHSEKYDRIELFQYVMTSLMLALYLKNYTSYFPAQSGDEDLNLLTSVLLRHTLQLICNGFCISVTDTESHLGLSEKKIGSAIYISASMMNHSCEPSAARSYYQNYLIIRAEKDIKKGEEVFISYGPKARIVKRAKRQEVLSSQYFFKCECQQCLQKFDIQDQYNAYKCSICKGPSVPIEENSKDAICLSCGQNCEISLDILKKENKFYSLINEGGVLESNNDIMLSLEKYLQAWKISREIFYKFHMNLGLAAKKVVACLMDLREFEKCILFLKCCVLWTEKRFGFLSFELSYELKSLADVITVYVINNKSAKNARDLAQEGLLYYKKLQKIFSFFPEYNCFEDLESHIGLLQRLTYKICNL